MNENYKNCHGCKHLSKPFSCINCRQCLNADGNYKVSGWEPKEAADIDKILDPRD